MSDIFLIKNVLRQGDGLSPSLFKSALRYTIWRVQVNQDVLILSVTHQLLIYADDVNILEVGVYAIEKNRLLLTAEV